MDSRRFFTLAGWVYSTLVALFLLLPVIIIIPASFSDTQMLEFPPVALTARWYEHVTSNLSWQRSALVSLRIALSAALIATIVGLLIALAQYRFSALTERMRIFLMLPLIIPNIILASGLFPILLQTGGLGTEWILILTGTAVSVPLVIITLVAAFDTLDPLLWTAASSLGARPLKIVGSILAPLMAISVVTSTVLAFQSVWDEITFAVFVGPVVNPPLTTRMYAYLQQNVTPEIAAIASLLLLTTLIGSGLVLWLSRLANRRRTSFDDPEAGGADAEISETLSSTPTSSL